MSIVIAFANKGISPEKNEVVLCYSFETCMRNWFPLVRSIMRLNRTSLIPRQSMGLPDIEPWFMLLLMIDQNKSNDCKINTF